MLFVPSITTTSAPNNSSNVPVAVVFTSLTRLQPAKVLISEPVMIDVPDDMTVKLFSVAISSADDPVQYEPIGR